MKLTNKDIALFGLLLTLFITSGSVLVQTGKTVEKLSTIEKEVLIIRQEFKSQDDTIHRLEVQVAELNICIQDLEEEVKILKETANK